MQNFIEERFPTDISFGSMGGPEFYTDIVTTHAGHEYRNIRWQLPRSKYNIAYGIHTEEQLARIRNFHYVTRGRAIGFRFQDPIDNFVHQQSILISNGKIKKIQLIKTYHLNQNDVFTKIIHKPVKKTVKIYLNNKEINDGYTVNYENGAVIFDNIIEKGTEIKADFEFDIPVRFDTDHLPIKLEKHQAAQFMDIPLIEILL